MHIRTFRAANLNEALAMIRDQMGPEAAVLHTRQLPAGRLNLFARKRIEVTAGLKPLRCSPLAPTAPAADAPQPEQFTPEQPAPEQQAPEQPAPEQPASEERTLEEPAPPKLSARRRAAELASSEPHPLQEFRDALIDVGLPRRIAAEWAAQSVSELELPRAALAQYLARSLRIGNPIETGRSGRRVVALVGPTGVGKTTTIAKLAAGLQLRQNARVALLTLDTFRAAAVEQLDAFARALGVPLAVVRSPREVTAALAQLGEVDLVLIDTVGQGPGGEEKIAAMGQLLTAARPDETHLVVDANGSFGSAADVCAAFQPLRPTAAILSKLDEARRPAPAIAAVLEGALQISYVTDGQRVPEDIAVADRQRLAEAAASGLVASGLAADGLVAGDLAAAGRGA